MCGRRKDKDHSKETGAVKRLRLKQFESSRAMCVSFEPIIVYFISLYANRACYVTLRNDIKRRKAFFLLAPAQKLDIFPLVVVINTHGNGTEHGMKRNNSVKNCIDKFRSPSTVSLFIISGM